MSSQKVFRTLQVWLAQFCQDLRLNIVCAVIVCIAEAGLFFTLKATMPPTKAIEAFGLISVSTVVFLFVKEKLGWGEFGGMVLGGGFAFIEALIVYALKHTPIF